MQRLAKNRATLAQLCMVPWQLVIVDECVTGDTRIVTDRGVIEMREVPVRNPRWVLSFDGTRAVWCRLGGFVPRGTARVRTIVLDTGRSIRCTADHRLFTRRGWAEARDVGLGDGILSLVDGAGASDAQSTSGAVWWDRWMAGYDPGGVRQADRPSAATRPWEGVGAWRVGACVQQVPPPTLVSFGIPCGLETRFEAVVAIEERGVEEVYDIGVDDTHCFFANGMLVHNCDTLLGMNPRSFSVLPSR